VLFAPHRMKGGSQARQQASDTQQYGEAVNRTGDRQNRRAAERHSIDSAIA
jgi:hypothetical protein